MAEILSHDKKIESNIMKVQKQRGSLSKCNDMHIYHSHNLALLFFPIEPVAAGSILPSTSKIVWH
jgi:hypothetical protein